MDLFYAKKLIGQKNNKIKKHSGLSGTLATIAVKKKKI
jgi:hypothetical protein